MFRRQSPNLGDVARQVVRGAFGGLYTYAVRRKLNESGLPAQRDVLARALLERQQAGELDFRGHRWLASAGTLPEPSVEHAPTQVSVTPIRWLRTIPADVVPDGILGEESTNEGRIANPTGWDLFRRLLPHYSECLRLSGAARLSQEVERHGKQFHLIRPLGPWWPDAAGPRVLRIARRDLGGDFLEGLYRRRTEPLLLGYPLGVSPGPEGVIFVTPVSLLQCRWKIDDLGLLLWPQEITPRLNPEWVGRNRRRRNLGKMRLWLRDMESGEESGLASIGDEGWSDIADMAGSLETFVARDVAGHLNPATLDSRLDLGADERVHNVLGLFLVAPNMYTQGTRHDLEAMQGLSDSDLLQTALAPVFLDAKGLRDSVPPPVASPVELSEDQFVAAREGLSNVVTVISGPPGTGKSQVVCALMVSAAMSGRSVLLASHSHKALDAVQERMKEFTPEYALLARAKTEDSEHEFDFRAAIDALLSRLVDADLTAPLEARRAFVTARQEEAARLLDVTDALSRLTDELGSITKELERRSTTDAGTSARNGRGGAGWWTKLWFRASGWFAALRGGNGSTAGDESQTERLLSDAELAYRIASVEAVHRVAVAEIEELTRTRPLADVLGDLRTATLEALPDLTRALECAHADDRKRLTDLLAQAGLTRDSEEQRRLWQENADVILRHFPLWACTALSVPNRIPLVPGLFDYLIVDEATTCNIAQTLPLLTRAKRAIIVGDRLQTGMVNDLDGRREAEMLRRAGLNPKDVGRFSFSQVSLFDLMTSCGAARRHMLRDHFRCDPEIASYFSETFYGGRLFVRTDPTGLRAPDGTRTGIHWTSVEGPLEAAGRGCRSHLEARAIADHLYDLIETQGYAGTVGVVTPFRRQAELIIHLVEQRLSRDRIEAAQLMISTAHKFQGGARDVVLISLCYGPGMPRGAEWFLDSSRELINVAVSRAKAVCHIFGNREAARNSSIRHIRRLAQPPASTSRRDGSALFESPWERKLYERLVAGGFEPISQYPLAGRRLDLAIIRGGARLDIEVDGEKFHRDPDGFRKVSDHWRDHVVRSLGWRVCRFWVYQLRDDMEGCVEHVREQLG